MPSPTQVGLRMLFAASQVKVVNKSIFVGFVALMLVLKITCANAQQFGTAEEARAMLDRAVAALRSDQIKALREFNDADNKEFHDRDLYVSCFNIADGVFTAAPSAMVGMDIRSFNVGDDPMAKKPSMQSRVRQKETSLRWTLISRRRVSQLSSSLLRLASAIRAAPSLFTNNQHWQSQCNCLIDQPARLNGSLFCSRRDRKIAASIGSLKQYRTYAARSSSTYMSNLPAHDQQEIYDFVVSRELSSRHWT